MVDCVTLTTVGYGDIVPMTVVGKFVATLTALMGVRVVAVDRHCRYWIHQSGGDEASVEAEITSALSDGKSAAMSVRKLIYAGDNI